MAHCNFSNLPGTSVGPGCMRSELEARITTLEAQLAARDRAIRALHQALVSAQAVSRVDAESLKTDNRNHENRRRLAEAAIWHSTLAASAFEAVEAALTTEEAK